MEPVTFLTDFLVAVFCVLFAIQIKKESPHNLAAWRYFFIFMGISSLIGAFAHLFFHYTGIYFKMVSWAATGISIYFAEKASYNIFSNRTTNKVFTLISLVKLAAYIVLLIVLQSFLVSKINIILGLIGISTTIFLIKYIKEKEKAYLRIASGYLVAISLVFIHGFKIAISRWFNHNDLSHVFMILCLYIIYTGVIKLKHSSSI